MHRCNIKNKLLVFCTEALCVEGTKYLNISFILDTNGSLFLRYINIVSCLCPGGVYTVQYSNRYTFPCNPDA